MQLIEIPREAKINGRMCGVAGSCSGVKAPAEERSAENPHATFCGNGRRATASRDPVARVTRVPRTLPILPGSKNTSGIGGGPISAQREAHKYADCGGHRYRDQKPEEAEQVSESEQREHQPDRVQMDSAADQTGRQYVIAHGLADEENRDDRRDCRPSQTELRYCHGQRHDKPCKRAEVGHET